MNIPTIPDRISPIVGYRVWNWHATKLSSLNRMAWRPGRALIAKCRTTDHEAPVDHCSCGVYATKSYQHLQQIIPVGAFVHGEVYLWGTVVEHDAGYRAQFAYPKSLVLPSTIDPRLERSRVKRLTVYGADISLPPNVLLWTKESGYTRAGLDLLNQKGIPCGEWCKHWHERILQPDDCVMVLGRGIGLVIRDLGSSGCTSDSVCVRLMNNDLYIIPQQDIVWNCQNWRWEVDLSGYRDAVILRSSDGWKILCRPLEQTG